VSPFMNSDIAARRVLIVAPDQGLLARLMAVAARTAHAEGCRSFRSARSRLDKTAYDLLVTDARLAEYNGLHLVHLARFVHPTTRAIVFDSHGDSNVATDVQRAAAFFEAASHLVVALPSYIASPLPPTDRRTPVAFDRRTLPRGGRRIWDRHLSEHTSSTRY